ncbi:MAG: hypothetical protein IJW45_06855 [Oscillospiraceae bacterium]|nr:hypothetical protein [Oscillospiraceae bacterium]
MSKCFKILLCLLLITSVLAGCAAADFTPVAEPFVEEMMDALASEDLEAAMALMHPVAEEQLGDMTSSFQAMAEYVDGRLVTGMERESVYIHNSIGTNTAKTEDGSFRVTMDDGSVLVVEYCYLENGDGSGFSKFQLSVGA